MRVRQINEPLRDKDQTGRRMYALVNRFSGDLRRVFVKRRSGDVAIAHLPLAAAHRLVREIPYAIDDKPIEVVARPSILLRQALGGLDCKKKGVLMGAWCRENGIPFRFIASSRRRDGHYHHVFPQGYFGSGELAGEPGCGRWRNLDATYANMRPFQYKQATAACVLKP